MKTLIRQRCRECVHQVVAVGIVTLVSIIPVHAIADDLVAAQPCIADLKALAEADTRIAIGAVRSLSKKISDNDASITAAATIWLGVSTPEEVEVVETVFSKAVDLANSLTFHCVLAHDEGILAAVANEESNLVIYLYPDYFEAPGDLNGNVVPSRAGVIFHELMHMALEANDDMLGSDVYDEREILELAKTDPQMAQRNATNWEYFLYEVSVDH